MKFYENLSISEFNEFIVFYFRMESLLMKDMGK